MGSEIEGTYFKEELEETHRSSNDSHNLLAPPKEVLQAKKTPRLQDSNVLVDVEQMQMMKCIICHPYGKTSNASGSSSPSSSRHGPT